MLDRWLAAIVIHFVLAQIEKALGALNWPELKAKLDESIRNLVPGKMFDEVCVSVANAILDRAQAMLSDEGALKDIMEKLAAGDYEGAFLALQMLLMGGWRPVGTTASPNGYKFPDSAEGKAAALVNAA